MAEIHSCPLCGQPCYGRICWECHNESICAWRTPTVCVCARPQPERLSPFPGHQCGRCKRVILDDQPVG